MLGGAYGHVALDNQGAAYWPNRSEPWIGDLPVNTPIRGFVIAIANSFQPPCRDTRA